MKLNKNWIEKKRKKKFFEIFFRPQEVIIHQWDPKINTQRKILRRLRYKNIYVDGQKKALRLYEGYITKKALKSPRASNHGIGHTIRLASMSSFRWYIEHVTMFWVEKKSVRRYTNSPMGVIPLRKPTWKKDTWKPKSRLEIPRLEISRLEIRHLEIRRLDISDLEIGHLEIALNL